METLVPEAVAWSSISKAREASRQRRRFIRYSAYAVGGVGVLVGLLLVPFDPFRGFSVGLELASLALAAVSGEAATREQWFYKRCAKLGLTRDQVDELSGVAK